MTPFAFIAVEKAPQEKFSKKENFIYGYWLADLFDLLLEPYEWESPLIDTDVVEKVYERLSNCLKTEEERGELLSEIQKYDSSIELDDLMEVKKFLQVCVENKYSVCLVE